MFFWFVASAVLVVLFVFDSPSVDYRFVVLGGVAPLIEDVSGRPLVLHTLIGSVGLLALVMLFTRGRRILRRQILGAPIGTFVFLVTSGAWSRTGLFWWPMAGVDEIARRPLPEFDRPLALLVVMELIGLVAMVWLVAKFELADQGNRRRLAQTGRLPRELLR